MFKSGESKKIFEYLVDNEGFTSTREDVLQYAIEELPDWALTLIVNQIDGLSGFYPDSRWGDPNVLHEDFLKMCEKYPGLKGFTESYSLCKNFELALLRTDALVIQFFMYIINQDMKQVMRTFVDKIKNDKMPIDLDLD